MENTVNAPGSEAYVEEHVRTYRKFVAYARVAAVAVPFFVGFVLYWTT